jgi:hypothetical protein
MVVIVALVLVAAALALAAWLGVSRAQVADNTGIAVLALFFVVGYLAIAPLVTVSRFNDDTIIRPGAFQSLLRPVGYLVIGSAMVYRSLVLVLRLLVVCLRSSLCLHYLRRCT